MELDTVSMSITLDDETYQALQRMAARSGTTPETLVSGIVSGRILEGRDPAAPPCRERRLHRRRAVSLPAVLQIETGRALQCRPARILDLSLGGMKLRMRDISPELAGGIQSAGTLEAVFNLPGSTSPLSLTCDIRRTEWSRSLFLGASIRADNPEGPILRAFLGQPGSAP